MNKLRTFMAKLRAGDSLCLFIVKIASISLIYLLIVVLILPLYRAVDVQTNELQEPILETLSFVDAVSDELQTASSENVAISIADVTNTSITLNLYFNPVFHEANNILRFFDFTVYNPPYNGDWIEAARGLPGGNITVTLDDRIPGATYLFIATAWNSELSTWESAEITVQTDGAGIPSIVLEVISPTEVIINATFIACGDSSNTLSFWNGNSWQNIWGERLSSGEFRLDDLIPGRVYSVNLHYMDRLSGTWSAYGRVNFSTPLPPQEMEVFVRENMEFKFDYAFFSVLGPELLNSFLDSTNRAVAIQHDLVGGDLPFGGTRMRIETSRNLPWFAEGRSGLPITLSIYNSMGHPTALHHAHMMRTHNVYQTEGPIHEIAHNFQNPRWNFEAEVLAVFATYYHFYITGEDMVVSNVDRVFSGGEGFREYMRSYASRVPASINHEAAMEAGVFSDYSFAYVLSRIQQEIGWEPFKQTFRVFNDLDAGQVPSADSEILKLFLSLLSDFSGTDVIALILPEELAIYEDFFGPITAPPD